MKSNIIATILFILASSCSNISTNNTDNIISYTIPYTNNDPYFWDEHFEYSHHITLETVDKSIFRHINRLIIQNDLIYILCTSTKSIYIFNINGKFENKINHNGSGPEDYLTTSDICIDKSNNILILDKITGYIYTYDRNGTYKCKIKAVHADSFLTLDNELFLYNKNYSRNTIPDEIPFNFIISKDTSILYKDIEYHPMLAGKSNHYGEGNSLIYSSINNNNIYISFPQNDTLYVYKNNKLNRLCHFDFKVERPNINSKNTEVSKYLEKESKLEVPTSPHAIFYDDKYIFATYYFNQYSKQFLISKSDKKVTVSNPTVDKNGLYITPTPYTNNQYANNYILSISRASNLIESNNNSAIIQKMKSDINENEESNPILVFYKMK